MNVVLRTTSRPRALPLVTPMRAVVLGALVNSAILITCAQGLWFFGDDWDFLLHRAVAGPADRGLLEPHKGHWSTASIVIFRAIFAVVGLSHYLPYALPVILCHAATGLLLFDILRRVRILEWNAALVALGVLFVGGGVGGENTLWDFQVGFVAPAVLGLLSLRILLRSQSSRALLTAAAVLVAGLTFSGASLVMTVWVGVFSWVAFGRRIALPVTLPSAITYSAWYLARIHR